MFKLEKLENNTDLEALLEPKKKIHELISTVNGSMLNFHKAVKTSKEIEEIAERTFAMKQVIKSIQTRSSNVRVDDLVNKLQKVKAVKAEVVDFI